MDYQVNHLIAEVCWHQFFWWTFGDITEASWFHKTLKGKLIRALQYEREFTIMISAFHATILKDPSSR